MLKGKNILITGGTGTFGNAFTHYALKNLEANKIILLSRDELKQSEQKPLFESDKIRWRIGDVRDKSRLAMAFRGVDIVIHAAALKQIGTGEDDPIETVKTNIYGTQNVLEAAIHAGVEKLLLISSDKAVSPENLYGASKMVAERLVIAANQYAGPKCSVVRYGNVAGSRGSVIEVWRKIKAAGSKFLPVTDERMTRFWIEREEAALFVAHCLEGMGGGEIFIPRMPSFKIVDLSMAFGLPYRVVGLRPGEKLHEKLDATGVDSGENLWRLTAADLRQKLEDMP